MAESDIGMEVIDGRDALGIIIFRGEGDQISTEIKGVKIPKLDLAKLCMLLGRALKAQHDAESAGPEHTDCCECGVAPGELHTPGCDVARCKDCGFQAIAHTGHTSTPTTWTGEWPGTVECRELGWLRPDGGPDLNRLSSAAVSGALAWNRDRERWEPAQQRQGAGFVVESEGLRGA